MNTIELKRWTEETGLYKTGHGFSYWVEILSDKANAPEDGLYLFVCLDDNHFEYTLCPCYAGDILHNSMIQANRQHVPDFLLAYHPIARYTPKENTWIPFKPGDTAKISGIYVCLIRKASEELYIFQSYSKGDNMLKPGFYQNGKYEEFQDYELVAYHACFYYTTTQLGVHNELLQRFNHK